MTRRWTDPGAPGHPHAGSADWAEGYVVDIPYFEPVLLDVTPAWLSMASVFHGQPPLDLSRPLTWLDLGAASGISSCMVAAANPNVHVWGFDHNPAHVERGRSLASRAGLDNCWFEEASFARLAADRAIGPAEADVIVVSGVYSWISTANQALIRQVIDQRLRPGGLAYVMYESATGWSSMVPVAEALRLLAEVDGRRPDLAFHDAAAVVRQLADAGARCFPLGSSEQSQMERWPSANGFYAAHEYLGSHFGPLLFDEVLAGMADARCSYVGQLGATDHLPAYWAPPGLAEVVHAAPDLAVRELYRDLIGQRPLRQDLYRRGLAVSTLHQQEAALASLSVVGTARPLEDRPVEVLGGGVALDPAYYEPLVGALTLGPLDLVTIAEIHTDWSPADAASALAFLVAGGYAVPTVPGGPTPATEAACRRLTAVLIAENRLGADHGTAMSPVTGGGVDVDPVGLLALGLLHDGADAHPTGLAEAVVADLGHQGRTVREGGELVDEPDRAVAVVADRVQRLLQLRHQFGL